MSSPSQSAVTSTRRAWRFKPEQADEAYVEFDLADGSHWMLGIVEIGAGGVGFDLQNGYPPLAVDTRIDAVTIRVRSLRLRGSMRIAHVTTKWAADAICGAEFTPSTDEELRKLTVLIEQFEHSSRRSG